MKKKKLTPLQQEYKKQIARIKRIMRESEKKGIHFLEPEEILPPKRKRITVQYINKIKKIKPVNIRQQGYITIEETGELVPYKEPPKTRKKQDKSGIDTVHTKPSSGGGASPGIKPEPIEGGLTPRKSEPIPGDVARWIDPEPVSESNQVIHTFEVSLININNREIVKYLKELLDDEITAYGEEEIARRIQNAPDDLKEAAEAISMDSNSIVIKNNALYIAQILTNYHVTLADKEKIEELVTRDLPWANFYK